MATCLSREQWMVIKPPIHWVNTDIFKWNSEQTAMAYDWIEDNCQDWYYIVTGKIVFGNLADAVMFRMWAQERDN